MRSLLTAAALVLGSLLLAAVKQDAAAQAGVSTLTAEQILERTVKTYASCKSYRDTGNARVAISMPRPPGQVHGKASAAPAGFTQDKHFRTAFVRPDRFRWEYSEVAGTYTVCRQGAEVKSYWTLQPEVRTQPSLQEPLIEAAGISAQSSLWIPGLLFRDEVGSPLMAMVNAKRLSDESIADAPCFLLADKLKDAPLLVWIDQRTFLIRKIHLALAPGSSTTITFEGAIDVDVSDAELAFGVADGPRDKGAGEGR